MTPTQRFEGVLAVLVTPLLEDETVDEGALRQLVRRVLRGGVHGIVVLGSAGEFAVLSDAEKKRAIAAVVDEAGGRVPIIAGTGEPGTRRAVAMTQIAAVLGADGAMVVPPFYYRSSQEAVLRHYRTLAAEGGLPIILYNIPGLTKVSLDLETVQTLADEPGIVGIKDSSGNLRGFQRLASAVASERFSVMTGSDDLLFAATVAGGTGSISPGANVAPEWFVGLWQAMKRGEWSSAWEIQRQIHALHLGIGYGSFPAGIKCALCALGIGNGMMATPNLAVTGDEAQAIRLALVNLGLLTS